MQGSCFLLIRIKPVAKNIGINSPMRTKINPNLANPYGRNERCTCLPLRIHFHWESSSTLGISINGYENSITTRSCGNRCQSWSHLHSNRDQRVLSPINHHHCRHHLRSSIVNRPTQMDLHQSIHHHHWVKVTRSGKSAPSAMAST